MCYEEDQDLAAPGGKQTIALVLTRAGQGENNRGVAFANILASGG